MAVIKETGDEWVVEPAPIVVPEDEPNALPVPAPAVTPKEPVGVGRADA